MEFPQHRVRRVLNVRQRGREVCRPALGAEGRTKDREEDVMSDRQRTSRNPALRSQIYLDSKHPHCDRKFAKDLKDTESEIRGNLEAFH